MTTESQICGHAVQKRLQIITSLAFPLSGTLNFDLKTSEYSIQFKEYYLIPYITFFNKCFRQKKRNEKEQISLQMTKFLQKFFIEFNL